jgi:hypothetical protein
MPKPKPKKQQRFSGSSSIWLQASRRWCADAVQPSCGGIPEAG